jgi:hypothetical protein
MSTNTNNGRTERQVYGAGGNLYQAWRTVKKGGVIEFDGSRFQSEELLPFVGCRVWVQFDGDGAFANGPIKVYRDCPRIDLLCTVIDDYTKNNP